MSFFLVLHHKRYKFKSYFYRLRHNISIKRAFNIKNKKKKSFFRRLCVYYDVKILYNSANWFHLIEIAFMFLFLFYIHILFYFYCVENKIMFHVFIYTHFMFIHISRNINEMGKYITHLSFGLVNI